MDYFNIKVFIKKKFLWISSYDFNLAVYEINIYQKKLLLYGRLNVCQNSQNMAANIILWWWRVGMTVSSLVPRPGAVTTAVKIITTYIFYRSHADCGNELVLIRSGTTLVQFIPFYYIIINIIYNTNILILFNDIMILCNTIKYNARIPVSSRHFLGRRTKNNRF